jgi:hypothetical protein
MKPALEKRKTELSQHAAGEASLNDTGESWNEQEGLQQTNCRLNRGFSPIKHANESADRFPAKLLPL